MAKVRLDTDGGHIWLSGTLPSHAGRCKAIPGARYGLQVGGERDQWRYPLDMSTCYAARKQFGQDLLVSAELGAWAREALAVEATVAALRAADSADLTHVPGLAPAIAAAQANRTYQQVGSAFVATAGPALLADQPGLGKTIMALGGLVERYPGGGAHLVLAPKTAVGLVWGPEVIQWLPGIGTVYELSGTRAKRQATLDAALTAADERGEGEHIFIVGNVEMARKRADGSADWPELFARTWTAVIVDESHRALIRTSGKPTLLRRGMTALRAEHRLAMSGTPMRGKPEQLWGTLNWLRPDLYTSYWSWVQRYFRLTSNRYSSHVLDGFREGGEEDLARDLGSVMLRRTKAEVLAELPPKTYPGTHLIQGDPDSPFAIWLEMTPAQKRAHDRLLRDGMVHGDGEEKAVNGHLAVATRQKQIAATMVTVEGGRVTPVLPSPKFDWCLDKITELGIPDGEGRIVIVSQFTSVLNLYAAELTRLGIAVHRITGEVNERERKAAADDFQSESPRARVFLLNTKAGGVAITLDAADDLVILDETYVPDDQEQVEDRIHRTSRMHNVTIHNLRTLDSIEEEIAYVTAAREDVAKYLMDESRGVSAAKALYLQAHRPDPEEN